MKALFQTAHRGSNPKTQRVLFCSQDIADDSHNLELWHIVTHVYIYILYIYIWSIYDICTYIFIEYTSITILVRILSIEYAQKKGITILLMYNVYVSINAHLWLNYWYLCSSDHWNSRDFQASTGIAASLGDWMSCANADLDVDPTAISKGNSGLVPATRTVCWAMRMDS